MPKRRKFINPFKGLGGGSSSTLNIEKAMNQMLTQLETQSGNTIERQTIRNPNVGKGPKHLQGKASNIGSSSITHSDNVCQEKTTKPNVNKVTQSYSHNVSESSATRSHNVTTKKNIKRNTFASNVSNSFGNVKRKKSVPKSVNRSGNVSESSATRSGTSGIVGMSSARTVNTTQTRSGNVGRSCARTVTTTQTRSGTVGRSSPRNVNYTSYTRSGNGTKRRSSMHKVKITRAGTAIEKQTIRRRTKHSWTIDIISK
ncbi:hypothetical protein ACFE04_014101 [Oxalis oulophora]